jgi:capsular exopolysaccharide synthesis family protein
LQQTLAQQSLQHVNAAVVSPAVIPTSPSSPNTPLVLSVAIAVGAGLATLAVFLLYVFDSTLAQPEDFERRTQLPVIAAIPEVSRADLRSKTGRVSITQLVPLDPVGPFADAVRRVRLALPPLDSMSDCHIAQFTSATFGEGKTVSAIAFAQAAACDGRRTLLIDADVRGASLTRSFNIYVEAGLMEVLAGRATLDTALVYDEDLQLHILPLSKYAVPSHDLFASQDFASLLEQLRAEFDLVVIDSAPALGVADTLALSSRVDSVIVAARWAHTPVPLVEEAIEAIQRVNGRIAGVVLTRVDAKTAAQRLDLHVDDSLLSV